MTKYAVIDVETTGLFNFSKPADAEGQPRMASMAIIKLDENLDEVETQLFHVKPDGWTMPPEATKINGLTTEFLEAHGEPVSNALDAYVDAVEDGYVIAAYGVDYDLKILRGELRRAGLPDMYEETRKWCLMRTCTDICQIPRASGKGWKFPKLIEACQHFGIEQAEHHTALADADAGVAILINLDKLGFHPEFCCERVPKPTVV